MKPNNNKATITLKREGEFLRASRSEHRAKKKSERSNSKVALRTGAYDE